MNLIKLLNNRKKLAEYHNKLIKEGLNEWDSQQYVKLYKELAENKNIDLPELDYKLKLTTPRYHYLADDYEDFVGNKYLKKKEANKLYELEKKEMIGSINDTEKRQLEHLRDKHHFNYLYYENKEFGGLDYEDYTDYKKLHKSLKTELKLSDKLLEQPLPKYKHSIKAEKIDDNTVLVKMKGVTEDGSLPPGYDIEELFTVDVTKCTHREKKVIKRWLGNDYQYFRDLTTRCGGDEDKFVQYVFDQYRKGKLKQYHNIKSILDGDEADKFKKAEKEIRKLARDIKHDMPVLENILDNNCTKKAITVWRTEEHHHLSIEPGRKPRKGDIVTLEGYNSTAVTKDGAEHFGETSHRDFEWMYEIELPVGTKGAYVAPLNENPKYAKEMEFLLGKDTKFEIVSFNEKRKYAKLRAIVD